MALKTLIERDGGRNFWAVLAEADDHLCDIPDVLSNAIAEIK